ncbi:MAG: hypothetical protein ACLVBJ_03180 [Pilosibacter sp.]
MFGMGTVLEERSSYALDKYLKVSRIIEAQNRGERACDSGRVMLNDKIASQRGS